jgi:HlyD family secretion protein
MTEIQTPTPVVNNGARLRAAKARRRWIRNIVILLIIVAVIAGFIIKGRKKTTNSTISTDFVTRRDLVETVSATGSVTAQTGAMVKIGSQITGIIKKLHADVGSKLHAGDMIAELDLPDLRAQVNQARANLLAAQERLGEQESGVNMQSITVRTAIEQARAAVRLAKTSQNQVKQSANARLETARANIRQAEANNTNAQASLKRTQQLYEKGYVAKADVDNAQAQAGVNAAQLASAQENLTIVQNQVTADLQSAQDQVNQAQSTLEAALGNTAQNAVKAQQVAQARASIAQTQAALQVQEAQLAKSVIRSPISGTVIQLAQQQGETIAAGLSAPTLIIVADLDRLQVDAYVDETDIGKVRLGQEASITVDAFPNQPFAGRVVKIASGSTVQQNVVTYDVTIALDNPTHLLKPDMTASVNIAINKRRAALVVPVDAVKQNATGETVTVKSKSPDGKDSYKMVPVKPGLSDGEYTEILSGLQEGQEVVLAGEVPGMTAQRDNMPRFGMFSGPGGRRSGTSGGSSGGTSRGGSRGGS